MPYKDTASSWKQVNISWSSDYDAVNAAGSLLAPRLKKAEAEKLISSWFFIRKGEWRLRYLPAHDEITGETQSFFEQILGEMAEAGQVTRWVPGIIYEAETNAFGGADSMDIAHELFHTDSDHILGTAFAKEKPRELSLLLCTAMMRTARLDWYEQGDIWDRVATHRPSRLDARAAEGREGFQAAVRRLITADTQPASPLRRRGGTLEAADDWFMAFERAGTALDALARNGGLTRGLRAIITHHIIFHWNRLGLPYAAQSRLATNARDAIFDEGPGCR